MALPRKVKTLETVPEAARGAYVQQGDEFVLDTEFEDVTGLKSNHERLLQQQVALKQRLAAFEGLDPDEYKTLKDDAAKRAQQEAEKKGEWEKLRTSLVEAHQKELAKIQEKVTGRDRAIEKLVRTNAAIVALKDAGGNVDLLLPHVESQIKVIEQDDDFVPQVLAPDGQPRISNGKGDPFTINDLVLEMRASPKFKDAFTGHSGEGSGGPSEVSKAGRTGSGTVSRTDGDSFLANLEKIAKGEVTVT